VIVAGVPVMVLVAVAAAWLLLGYGANRDQLDAIRTAGTLGVGFGGVVALWLAVRRQRSAELDLLQKYEAHQLAERVALQNVAVADRTAAHAEHDARERRLTDLYLKAVEQLGSDKAAVRHGALYALERVAQDNPTQRQTVVDVICAYLRSPYSPPLASGQGRRLGVRRPLLTVPGSRRLADGTRNVSSSPWLATSVADARQEREVRLTAQRILTRHLRPGTDLDHPVDTFWADIDLDLTGATLVNFDLGFCRLRTGNFGGASFAGDARFFGASFSREAVFDKAGFAEYALFEEASFAGDAGFIDASFAGDAGFEYALFAGDAVFSRAGFAMDAVFSGASFGGDAWFLGASFAGDANFGGASFDKDARFADARFGGYALFNKARFGGAAGFLKASFDDAREFVDAEFVHGVPVTLRTHVRN
jgi:hypothetical protein